MRQSSKNLLVILAIIIFTMLFMWAISRIDPHVVGGQNDDFFPMIIPQPDGSVLVF